MTLTIDLSPDAERELNDRAARDGLAPAAIAADLVRDGLAHSRPLATNPNRTILDPPSRRAAADADASLGDDVRAATDDGDPFPVTMAEALARYGIEPPPPQPLVTPEEAAAAAKSMRQMFAEWEAEDPITGPEDLAEREREWEEFKSNMNAASTRGHPIFP